MRRQLRHTPWAAGVALWLLAAAEPSPATEPSPPVVSEAKRDDNGLLVHSVTSEYQEESTDIYVLLPDKLEKGRRYRVLYMLTPSAGLGKSGKPAGLLAARSRDLHNKHELICVLATFTRTPWYGDHPQDPKRRQESYMLKVVLPFLEKTYPALVEPEGRLLVGFSKSGYGAFLLLLRHPDVFGRAASFDMCLTMGSNRYSSDDIYGATENFRKHYCVATLLKEKADLFKDSPEKRFYVTGWAYDFFREDHKKADALMTKLGIPHAFEDVQRTSPLKGHNWVSGWLDDAVQFLAGQPADR